MNQSSKETLVSTLPYPDHLEFFNRTRIISANTTTIAKKIRHLAKILNSAKQTHALLLNSTSYDDLFCCMIMALWKKSNRPVIIMATDMWQKDSGLPGVIQKAVLRFADRAITRYAPLSREEFPFFSIAWGIPENKLRFLPYFYTFTKEDLNSSPPPQENFIFAGGNAHRDYAPLVKAIESLPEYEFVIASHLLEGKRLPPNVKAGQVPRPEFIKLMRASRAVIVPIRKGLIRSTGHQTYLNGMLLNKPTIITDTLGVREYTRNGKAALIVDGSPEGYIDAIQKVMGNKIESEIETMCKIGYELASKEFTFDNHCVRLLEITDEAIEDSYSV
jgi:glycosyltransferase involved in cell wall biosynthesis